MPKSSVVFWDRYFYPDYDDNWDHKLFRAEILKHLDSTAILLDVGAGSGLVPEMNFKGLAGQVYGIDPDRRVLSNPYLEKAFIGFGDAMRPFQDNQFDVVICCNVLEHIQDPGSFFREIGRVLKKGGWLLTKTPNRFHYVALIAQITPPGFHRWFNRIRGRNMEDTFPTYYHVNTRKRQIRIAGQTGFQVGAINFYEGRPEYLRFSFIAYLPGIIYERIINGLGFSGLKAVMISKFIKR